MTSKELIQKLDSHMRVNKITRKSVADKLGVTSAEICSRGFDKVPKLKRECEIPYCWLE